MKFNCYNLSIDTRQKIIAYFALKDRDFVRFLKEKRVYKTFFKNIKRNIPIQHSHAKILIQLEYLREEYINWGLIWMFTPEGHNFWQRINNEWKKTTSANRVDKALITEVKKFLIELANH